MANQVIKDFISESSLVIASLLEEQSNIEDISNALTEVSRNGGTIYTCGNGGSACDAMHFTEELVARYKMERPGIKAAHFCDAGNITCWSNDYSYSDVFARQAETMMTENDALIGFTTSGNSENILKAFAAANKKNALTIALTGKDGGKCKDIANHSIVVKSKDTEKIQQAHITIVHIFCELIETNLFGNENE